MELESRYIRSLLQNAQAGNNAALEQLLEMNIERVYALSHRLSANQEEAEALASTVLFEAWKQLAKIRTDVFFNQWLESLTISVALQHHRESKAERKKWSFFRKKKIEIKEPDPKITPLGKEICNLPAPERTIFVLHQLEKYSIEELSDMMTIPTAEVNKLFERANDKLIKLPFIQTPEELSKKISELPAKLKADKKILEDALSRIYEKKLENWVEPEPVIKPTEDEENKDKREPEPEKAKLKKEIGIDIPAATPVFKRRIGWAALILLTAAGIYFLIITGSKSWEVNDIAGSVSVDGEEIKEKSSLSPGETLQTGENSSAIITLPEIGRITIEETTTFSRLDKKFSGELLKGTIIIESAGSSEAFSLSILSTIISNYSEFYSYKAQIKNDDKGWLLINKGKIICSTGGRDIYAFKDYVIEMDKESGCGIPYHKNTDPEIMNAVEEFQSSKSEFFVERIVSLAGYYDSITLWNLIKIVSPAKRLLVYGKLQEIIPHSKSISKENIIGLDQEKLLLWLNEIEAGM